MTIEHSKDYLRTLKRITKKRTLSSALGVKLSDIEKLLFL